MLTASVISGNGEAGEMVWAPLPGMSNSMASAPGVALASRIACRSEPAPESLVLVTVKVVEAWAWLAIKSIAARSADSSSPRAITLAVVALFLVVVIIICVFLSFRDFCRSVRRYVVAGLYRIFSLLGEPGHSPRLLRLCCQPPVRLAVLASRWGCRCFARAWPTCPTRDRRRRRRCW